MNEGGGGTACIILLYIMYITSIFFGGGVVEQTNVDLTTLEQMMNILFPELNITAIVSRKEEEIKEGENYTLVNNSLYTFISISKKKKYKHIEMPRSRGIQPPSTLPSAHPFIIYHHTS